MFKYKGDNIRLKEDLPTLMNGLNSRIKILNDWYKSFIKTARKGYKAFLFTNFPIS